jgi:predicted O-methyltransferase YrrM
VTDWADVDRYLEELLVPADAAFESALRESAGLPPHNVSPLQGKLLELLARLHGARSILEIGTLGGYSTLWLARARPERLITIEANEEHAAVARRNLAHLSQVELRVGAALDVLPTLRGPFDLFFIDADKKHNTEYFDWALKLSRPGSAIVIDNVIRSGAVLDAASADPSVQGVRRMNDRIANEPRVSATAIQTVGSKGHDGFLLALVMG